MFRQRGSTARPPAVIELTLSLIGGSAQRGDKIGNIDKQNNEGEGATRGPHRSCVPEGQGDGFCTPGSAWPPSVEKTETEERSRRSQGIFSHSASGRGRTLLCSPDDRRHQKVWPKVRYADAERKSLTESPLRKKRGHTGGVKERSFSGMSISKKSADCAQSLLYPRRSFPCIG